MKTGFRIALLHAVLVSSLAIAIEEEANRPQFCIYELYGTSIDGANGQSKLLKLNPNTGEGSVLVNISGQGVHHVSAIDFSSDGTLYGIGQNANNESVLIAIHCVAGWARIIGPTGIAASSTVEITDIDFDDHGVLWAYLKNGNADSVGTIDVSTGAYTEVGYSGISDQSHGLGFGPTGTLYHVGSASLSAINLTTGSADSSSVTALGFEAPADTNPHFVTIDRRINNGILFGNLSDQARDAGSPAENYLVSINPENGRVSFLASPVRKAPDNLAGIAFNPSQFGIQP